MTVKAIVLVENSVFGNLGAVAEHGWSVWLETPAGPFLFDTGQGDALHRNAAVFGIPLSDANAILVEPSPHRPHRRAVRRRATLRQHPGRDRVPVHAHPDLFKDSFLNPKASVSSSVCHTPAPPWRRRAADSILRPAGRRSRPACS